MNGRNASRRPLDRTTQGFRRRHPDGVTDHVRRRGVVRERESSARRSFGGRFGIHSRARRSSLRSRETHANANRLRVIRAIPIAIGSSTTRFRVVVQKNFLRPSIDESDAIPSSRAARSRAARRIMPAASSARRACKKSAIYKGFLHLGKIADELSRGAKVFAALDKKFAASRCASIVARARVNASLRRESVFFIAL
jgi:hypothetical protein